MDAMKLSAAVSDASDDVVAPAAQYFYPPGLELPEYLNSLVCATSTACTKTDTESVEIDSLHSAEPEEYQVLLQNLPKAVLKEGMLRAMVKKAKLKNIKKLAFRSDGRAVISVTTFSALCQCIEHFNGLPWFYAPTCTVPVITATHVQTAKSRTSFAANGSPVQQPDPRLSADAHVFVPGSEWTAKTANAAMFIAPSHKLLDRSNCLSHASTDSGLSSDEASCGYDSGSEGMVALCV